jgi:hypothetical protein
MKHFLKNIKQYFWVDKESSMIPKIMLALIHNNNEERNAYIKPKLQKLNTTLSRHFEVRQIEVSYQSELIPHSSKFSLYREFIYHRLMNDFYILHSIKGRSHLKAAIGFIRHIAKRYLFTRGDDLALWQRKSAIEMLLTEKHIAAWRQFLDSNCAVLVCFEDDAIIEDRGIDALLSLILKCSLDLSSKPIFVDLAGGSNIVGLGLIPKQEIPEHGLILHTPGLSNTTCSYLMTRSMAKSFYAILEKTPALRIIGADWLINKLFSDMTRLSQAYDCFHAEPPYFVHGTVSGAYTTSIV